MSAVGTAWMEDPEALLGRMAAGRAWGEATRKVTLTRERYPGLERLLGALP